MHGMLFLPSWEVSLRCNDRVVGNGDAGPERGRSRGKSGGRWLDEWFPGLTACGKVVVELWRWNVSKAVNKEGWVEVFGRGRSGSSGSREFNELRY